ncbi:hypothetical protein WSM22_13590 [Cytophagales bacterium WSM2-2]|nr:hypothetical protein WSM22_13590 [Cytophagales bacterium WSM2-2]
MFKFDRIPFYFRAHENQDNGGFPRILPFQLYFDEDLGMFRQKPTPDLRILLDQVYKQGSLAEGSLSRESGKTYRGKFVDYLLSNNSGKLLKVLEVGFGSGIILKELKDRGFGNLTGIEPGDHARVNGLSGVRLIHDYFPSKEINGKFDLVYSLMVLEHIEDPVQYLKELVQVTSDEGKIIIGVPNCETCLQDGDVSVFIHEHFSYFTRASIAKLASKTEFHLEDISIIEGSFIFTLSKKADGTAITKTFENPGVFYERVKNHIDKLRSLLEQYEGFELAIYTPIRAMNALYIIGRTDFRLVDDSTELRSKYLAGLTSPIESFEDMASNPPKYVLIFSRTFGDRIKTKCLSDPRLRNTKILTLDELDKIQSHE